MTDHNSISGYTGHEPLNASAAAVPNRAAATTADVSADTINDTSASLISADKVQGTAVYNHDDERLGTVDSIMIDKRSGEVGYAVMSFGGFLGIGERYHQLPWDVLDYDTGRGGYVVDLNREQLDAAPSYSRDELSRYDYDSRGEEIDSYYSGLAIPAWRDSETRSGVR